MGQNRAVKIRVGRKAVKLDIHRGASIPNPFWGNSHDFSRGPFLLNSTQLLDKILWALEKREPLSIVSIGQTEAFVMAQYVLFTEEEFLSHRESVIANQGSREGFMHRGIRFPNVAARDETVEAVRRAHIIGCNTIEPVARDLTERVFAAHGIKPRFIFEAHLRRVFMFSQKKKFEEILRGKKILLIGALAQQAMHVMDRKLKRRLGFEIVGAIPIYENEEIPAVKNQISFYNFDLCLLAAGVNAVILASYIANTHGRVAVDIGSGMESLVTGHIVTDSFVNEVIGLENLLGM